MKKLFFSLTVSLAWLATNLEAAISISAVGSGTIGFDTLPAAADWSTVSYGGGAGAIANEAALDAAVQTNAASNITGTLPTATTVPPNTFNGGARWNSTAMYLQTRPTTVSYLLLLATLRNDTGSALSQLGLRYDLGVNDPLAGELPGHRVYFSLTGAAGSWQLIPGLSGIETAGTVSTNIALGSWPSGSTLYILWADDNANNITDPSYTIDNVVFFTGFTGIAITSPTNNQPFAEGLPITIDAAAALPGNITQVEFFSDGLSIGIDNTAPYSVVYNGAALGSHQLTAAAIDDQTNMETSLPVTINIVRNVPPLVTITNLPAGPVLVGTTVASRAVVSDTAGTFVTNVDWYVDGIFKLSDGTSPFTFQLGDVLVGTYMLQAVATDNLGLSETGTLSVTATNPTGVTLIVTNGSIWRYLDDGSDQGAAWTALPPTFDDSAWSIGQAELGYGDDDVNRLETTVIGFGGVDTNKFATTYFRHHFDVTDPSAYGDLVLRLLRDDGARVFINGTEVFRSALTNDVIDFSTYSGTAVGDDGAVYQVTNINASVLVAGPNVVAVEVHQSSRTSSDVSFDLMLWGTGPRLIITPSGSSQVEISWRAPATGFVLQSATDLNAPSWSAVGGVTSSGGFNRATVNTSGTSRFFRLRRP